MLDKNEGSNMGEGQQQAQSQPQEQQISTQQQDLGRPLSSTIHAAPFLPENLSPKKIQGNPNIGTGVSISSSGIIENQEENNSRKTKLSPDALAFVPPKEVYETAIKTPTHETRQTRRRMSKARQNNGNKHNKTGSGGNMGGNYIPSNCSSSSGSPYRIPVKNKTVQKRYLQNQMGFFENNPNNMYLLSPGKAQLATKFVSEQLKRDLQQKNFLNNIQLPEETLAEMGFPLLLQNYHSLNPLEDIGVANEKTSSSFGIRTCILKGISVVDGAAYALRRLDGRDIVASPSRLRAAHEAVDQWQAVANHPNIVTLRGTFVSNEIQYVSSLFLVYDYFSAAITLRHIHIQNRSVATEEQLWSYLVQLCSALRAIHSAGLYCRPEGLTSSKILMTGYGRLRVNAAGIFYVLAGDKPRAEDLPLFQCHDLIAVGKLMLELACAGVEHGLTPYEYCALRYSPEFVRLITTLLQCNETRNGTNWKHIAMALSEKTMSALDSTNLYNDTLMNEMSKEVENGRFLRLLIKLGFINERPGNEISEESWSETGDRYLLKLFRDYVFHQTTESGSPLMDWGHVIECLNKLDAGVPERLILMSRDEKSLLVVSYADIKRCVESTYGELQANAEESNVGISKQQQQQQQQYGSIGA